MKPEPPVSPEPWTNHKHFNSATTTTEDEELFHFSGLNGEDLENDDENTGDNVANDEEEQEEDSQVTSQQGGPATRTRHKNCRRE